MGVVNAKKGKGNGDGMTTHWQPVAGFSSGDHRWLVVASANPVLLLPRTPCYIDQLPPASRSANLNGEEEMHLSLLLLSTLLVLLLGGSVGQANEEPATEVRLATWNPVDFLDPAYTTTAEEVQVFDALFQGLVNVEDGSVVGADAQSWTISDDGRIYTFTLREDIVWSDGHPVTTHDYVLAFRRMLMPRLNLAPRPTYLLRNIRNAEAVENSEVPVEALGVRAIDERVLEIQLASPASYFLDILAYPGMVPVPAHLIEKYGDDWWKLEPLVSNGVYILIRRGAGEHMVLHKRNRKDYPEAPDIAHLIYTRNIDGAMRRVISNELDIIYDIRKSEVNWVKNRIGFRLTTIPLPNTVYAIFNTKSKKLANKQVRRALALAIDRDVISRATNSQPTNSFADIRMLKGAEEGLRHEWIEKDRKDRVTKARFLLYQAGYTTENPLEITILKEPRQLLGNTAIALRSMFSQIGVKAEMDEVDANEHSRRLAARAFEVSTSSWMADYNDAMTFYSIMESGVSKNFSSFSNADYDGLLHKALRERDDLKRRKIYVQLENILRDESPIVPIAHSGVTIVSAPTIVSIGLAKIDPRNDPGSQKFMISIYNIKLSKEN